MSGADANGGPGGLGDDAVAGLLDMIPVEDLVRSLASGRSPRIHVEVDEISIDLEFPKDGDG